MAQKLTGTQKIAVLILALGDEYVQNVFNEMNNEEIIQVSKAMTEIDTVPQETVEEILQEFNETFSYGQKSVTG